MTRYRLVHFVTDALREARVPLGALVEGPDGVRVVLDPQVPPVCLLGGADRVPIWRCLQQLLAGVDRFDELPRAMNLLAALGEPRDLPDADPIGWLEAALFPPPPDDQPDLASGPPRLPEPADTGIQAHPEAPARG